MIQYRIPIRRNVPQTLNYAFKDQSNAVIPLTNYVSVSLEAKLQGSVYFSTPASFVSQTLGQVTCFPVLLDTVGEWDLQFVCLDGSGNMLYGEPLQAKVVPNVDDLALDQLAAY